MIFRHSEAPEAGLQVPAGTLEDGESPGEGVLREGREETGIEGLRIVSLLGEQVRDMSDFHLPVLHHRYFFHLMCELDLPDSWRHFEKSPSDDPQVQSIPFDFFWVPLNDVPTLIADHDRFLSELRARLGAAP